MPTIELQNSSFTYTSEAITPVITSVKVKGETDVIPPTHYKMTGLQDNTEAGTGRFSIEETDAAINGDGDPYKIFGAADFKINKAALSKVTLSDTEFTYNHKRQITTVTEVKAGSLVVSAENYTVSGNMGVDVGTYTVTVKANEDTDFSGQATATFVIKTRSLENTDIKATLKREKDGSTYKYVPTIKDGFATLEEDKDYEMSTTPTTTALGYKEFTFTGINNFEGERTLEFVDLDFEQVKGSTSDYAALFQAKANMATPMGVTVNLVTGATKKNTVKLKEVSYIPTGEPVLLLTYKQTYGFVKDDFAPSSAADVSENKLETTTVSTHFNTGQIYLFYNGEFVLNAAGNLEAGTIYLDLGEGSSGAPQLSIVRDEETGINDVRGKMTDVRDVWYTLDGRRLNGQPAKPGLYLNKGRKVVIKR